MPIHKTTAGLERIHIDNIAELAAAAGTDTTTDVTGTVTIELVKETNTVFTDETVIAAGIVFSTIIDVTTAKSVLIIGNQTTDVINHIEGITLEVWGANTGVDDDFWGPCALGEFSSGYLYFGSFDCNFKFLKIRVVNTTAVNTVVNVKMLSVI